jgi:hypothetical protein
MALLTFQAQTCEVFGWLFWNFVIGMVFDYQSLVFYATHLQFLLINYSPKHVDCTTFFIDSSMCNCWETFTSSDISLGFSSYTKVIGRFDDMVTPWLDLHLMSMENKIIMNNNLCTHNQRKFYIFIVEKIIVATIRKSVGYNDKTSYNFK